MKKLLSLFLCLLVLFTLASCDRGNNPTPPNDDIVEPGEKPDIPGETPEDPDKKPEEDKPTDPVTDENVGFVIHFNLKSKDDSGKYKYNIWIWEKGKDGADFDFNGEDDYGVYSKVKFDKFSNNVVSNTVGFIIKTNKKWDEGASKDYDADRFIDFSSLDKDIYGYYHIWIMTGDAKIYTSPSLEVGDAITYFDITYKEKEEKILIWFQTNHDYAEFKIYQGEDVLADHNTDDGNVERKTTKRFQYYLTSLPDLASDIILEVKFKDSGKVLTKVVSRSALYSTKIFEQTYAYDGELGAIFTEESTMFKVWSPISTDIKLRVYNVGTPESVDPLTGDDTYEEHAMVKGEKGVWSVEIQGDLGGKYYTYVVTNSNYTNIEIVDPYAKSTGVNGLRGMVVDFDDTDPEGWDEVEIHDYLATELTVYETHIADLTSSSTWTGTKENAKKLKGFYEEGTI
jgi:pullulanase